MPEAPLPSPKVQAYAMTLPSGSYEPLPDSGTLVRVCVSWSGPALATGIWLGQAGVVALATLLGADSLPALSTAVTVHEYDVEGASPVSALEVVGAGTYAMKAPPRYRL